LTNTNCKVSCFGFQVENKRRFSNRWEIRSFSLCARDKVESVVRLPESSRARTKDNSRSCTIPCCYYRWALSGTDEAVSSSGKTRSGIKFAKELVARHGIAIHSRSYRGVKEKRKKKEEIPTASSSKGPRFRPIVSWISSGLTLRITSRRSFSFVFLFL